MAHSRIHDPAPADLEIHLPDSRALGVLKAVFDWSWKLIPLLWLAFQFLANQDSIAKKTTGDESRIKELETNFNAIDRQLVETRAEVKALKEQMDNDRVFYFQTSPPAKRQ